MFFSRRAGHKLVIRPDFADHDFILGDFTADNGWHALDLSAIIPKNTIAIIVCMGLNENAGDMLIRFRPKGYTGVYTMPRIETVFADTTAVVNFMLGVSSDRQIEYKISTSTWAIIEMDILGWFIK